MQSTPTLVGGPIESMDSLCSPPADGLRAMQPFLRSSSRTELHQPYSPFPLTRTKYLHSDTSICIHFSAALWYAALTARIHVYYSVCAGEAGDYSYTPYVMYCTAQTRRGYLPVIQMHGRPRFTHATVEPLPLLSSLATHDALP